MEKDQTVYTAPTGNCYHTDPECYILQRARKIRERSLEPASNLPLCEWCSGEYTPHAETVGGLTAEVLGELDPDDVG